VLKPLARIRCLMGQANLGADIKCAEVGCLGPANECAYSSFNDTALVSCPPLEMTSFLYNTITCRFVRRGQGRVGLHYEHRIIVRAVIN
jgi:hypothetical protein